MCWGQNVGQMSEGSGHLRRLSLYKYDHFPPVLISTALSKKKKKKRKLRLCTQGSDIQSLQSVSKSEGSSKTACGEF